MKMENIKKFFLVTFYGSFVLPLLTGTLVGLAVFLEIPFYKMSWEWILMATVEILFIFITIVLGLVYKLKEKESLTVEDVVKGTKKTNTIKKIEEVVLEDKLKKVKNRKDIKNIEKRKHDNVVESREGNSNKPKQEQSDNKKKKENKPTPMYFNLRK